MPKGRQGHFTTDRRWLCTLDRFGPGNGSPMATDVVPVVLVLVLILNWGCYCQLFKVLRLYSFRKQSLLNFSYRLKTTVSYFKLSHK